MFRKLLSLFALLLMSSLILTACQPAAPATEAPEAAEPTEVMEEKPTEAPAVAEKVTITWWTIETQEEHKALWQSLIDEYTAAHPNVTIEMTNLENEAFKTKLTTVMQSGEPPDLFQSWGGGVMNEYANAGLLRDITAELDQDGWRDTFSPGALGVYSYKGKNYGVPRDMGMVGFWYNKELFAQAGIDAPPATWSELLEDVQALKDAGITPISLGEGDKWPGHFWWAYLATRICGQAGFEAAASRSGSFADDCFVQAGETLQELIALEPFQEGFLAATYGDESTIMGNSEAAMELMGQWAPGAQKDNSADKLGLGDKLAWFPFPGVDGGAGAATDAFGGGNGFAVGKNAEPEAIDFLKFLSSVASQQAQATLGLSLPVVKGAETAVTDPMLQFVQQGAAAADYFQLYYDQALPPAVGSVVNDSVQGLFAGTLTPQQVAEAVEASAAQEIK